MKKAFAHMGLSPKEVAVVGDNPKDYLEIPHSIGITHTFLIDRKVDKSAADTPQITRAARGGLA